MRTWLNGKEISRLFINGQEVVHAIVNSQTVFSNADYSAIFDQTYTPLLSNVINPWRGWYVDVERTADSRYSDGSVNITWSNRNSTALRNSFKTDDYFSFGYPLSRNPGSSLTLLHICLAVDSRPADTDFAPLDTPLTQAQLDDLRAAFASARQAGIGLIIRVSQDVYGVTTPEGIDDPDFLTSKRAEPPNYDTTITHAQQIAELVAEYEDVVFMLQVGFWGPWGECHSSRFSQLVNGSQLWTSVNAGPQRAAFEASYNELFDKDVYIAMRRPQYMRNVTDEQIDDETSTNNDYGFNRAGYLGADTVNAAITTEQAFSQSRIARVAMFHDSLYGGSGSDILDSETWLDPRPNSGTDAQKKTNELNYVNRQALYTPVVGESYNEAQSSALTDSTNAFADNVKMRMTSINSGLAEPGGALQKWKTSTAFCTGDYAHLASDYDYAALKQGYCFVCNSATIGYSNFLLDGSIRLNLSVSNLGWGSLLKKCTVNVILRNGTYKYTATTDIDPRHWLPGTTTEHTLYFKLPSDLPTGNWDVHLQIQSPFDTIKDNKWFCILFNNEDMWLNQDLNDYRSKMNKLGTCSLVAGSSDYFIQTTQSGIELFDGIPREDDTIDPVPPVGKMPLKDVPIGTAIGGRTISFDPAIISEFNAASGSNGGFTLNPYNNTVADYLLYIDTDDKQFCILRDSNWSTQHDFISTGFVDFVVPANTTMSWQFENWAGTVPQSIIDKIFIST